MAVSHIYFLLIILIAVSVTSGNDVCSCSPCSGHRNRAARCECCRYYQIGRKRSGVVPASVQVSDQNGKGNYDGQSEDGASVGQNSHLLYDLDQLRHDFVHPCRNDDCISLWPQEKAGSRTDDLLDIKRILNDKKSVVTLCSPPAIFKRGGRHLCLVANDLLRTGLMGKTEEELTKHIMSSPYIAQSPAWRFPDTSADLSDTNSDMPVEFNSDEDFYE
ncbi:hypothetical protein BsWGS_09591 [Bradybaena similaris]